MKIIYVWVGLMGSCSGLHEDFVYYHSVSLSSIIRAPLGRNVLITFKQTHVYQNMQSCQSK